MIKKVARWQIAPLYKSCYHWVAFRIICEIDKSTKGMKGGKKGGEVWRYERNHSPSNLNGPHLLVVVYWWRTDRQRRRRTGLYHNSNVFINVLSEQWGSILATRLSARRRTLRMRGPGTWYRKCRSPGDVSLRSIWLFIYFNPCESIIITDW
jgi:hypothetical protein